MRGIAEKLNSRIHILRKPAHVQGIACNGKMSFQKRGGFSCPAFNAVESARHGAHCAFPLGLFANAISSPPILAFSPAACEISTEADKTPLKVAGFPSANRLQAADAAIPIARALWSGAASSPLVAADGSSVAAGPSPAYASTPSKTDVSPSAALADASIPFEASV